MLTAVGWPDGERTMRGPSLALVIDVFLQRHAVFHVCRDDAVEQLWCDLAVPDVVRVHHDHGTSRADEKAVTPRLADGLQALVASPWSLSRRAISRPSRLPVEEFARDDHLPHVLREVRDRVDEELEHGGLAAARGRRDHTRQIGRGQRG
jgi:hypothetical protein